jgi:aspartyl-tRNA(Asn)/glutamyl-tRNA(Gln) amidotransferase subunit B
MTKITKKNVEYVAKLARLKLSEKEKVLGYLVGQVMKETKGRANPQLVNKLLKKKI